MGAKASVGMKAKEVVVVNLARTPMGAFGGSYKHLSAIDLGVVATKAALQKSGVNPKDVDDVYFGNVISANLGQAPAKQVALHSGISPKTPSTTVNKVCASGMKAIEIGAMSIALGQNNVVLVGGMESMSNVPRYAVDTRFQPKPYGQKYGSFKPNKEANELDKFSSQPFVDGLENDGLSDPFEDRDAMGAFGVLCSVQNKLSRKEIDEFTLRSYKNAQKASKEGKFNRELATVPGVELEMDEEAKLRADKMSMESLGALKPAFKLPKKYAGWTKEQFEEQNGIKYENDAEFEDFTKSITAAGSSTMSDGAAALVLADREWCDANGIDYLCAIRGWGQASQIPEKFTSTPALASEKALKMAGLAPNDIDFYEVNEAFAVVPMITARQLELKDWEKKLNIYGGGCSMGHPIGCSGARITATLISAMLNENGKYGCAAICNGGGGASALVLENTKIKQSKL